MIHWVAAVLALLALGAHATMPWRGGQREALPPDGEASRWPLIALPLLLAAAAVVLLASGRPDSVAAIDAATASWPGKTLRAVLLLLGSLAVADLLLLLARDRLERAGWWLIGGFGVAFLLGGSLALEILRAGAASTIETAPLLAAGACRAAMALAAGEVLTARRPRWAPLAAAALAGYWVSLPTGLRDLLVEDGMLLTTAAAALLLAVVRWLPQRLRRPGLIAAVLLTAILLGRAMELTQALPLEPIVQADGV